MTKELRKQISKVDRTRNEILPRFKMFARIQQELRAVAKSYGDADKVPKELKLRIFENRTILRAYSKWIKDLNRERRKLSWQMSVESRSKNE